MSDESERVKKHNRSKMELGYKNVSFKISPEEYKLLKKARKERKMSTRELLMYFISEQYIKDRFQYEYEDHDEWKLSNDEKHQRTYNEYGTSHRFIGKKEFVLLAYLTVDRKKIKFIKDFESYEEAEEYYNNHKSKRRVAIFEKDEYSKENWYEERWWF